MYVLLFHSARVIVSIPGRYAPLQVYVSCNPTKTLAQDAVLLCGPESTKTKGMPFRPVKVSFARHPTRVEANSRLKIGGFRNVTNRVTASKLTKIVKKGY